MAIRKSVTIGTLKEVQQAVPRETAYIKGIKKSNTQKEGASLQPVSRLSC